MPGQWEIRAPEAGGYEPIFVWAAILDLRCQSVKWVTFFALWLFEGLPGHPFICRKECVQNSCVLVGEDTGKSGPTHKMELEEAQFSLHSEKSSEEAA